MPVRKKLFPAYNTIGKEEKKAVNRVLDSGVLSKYLGCWDDDFYGGPEVQALEKEWAKYFGVKHAKPSTYCFEKIRQAEQCQWYEMVYIGDNPAKDFVNLNKLGMPTVRVLTGVHKNALAKPGFDAKFTIQNLNELPALSL